MDVSLQLYTLKELTKDDFAGTLEQVAKAGYKGVEFAGYGGLTAGQMKNTLDNLGLRSVSSHISYELFHENLDEQIEYNLKLGTKFMICPYLKLNTREYALHMAEEFNVFGEKIKASGMAFGYHNHDFELTIDQDKYVLDWLFENCDPELVKTQLDVFWVKKGGADPYDFIKRYAGRIPLIHIKDIDANLENCDVGAGILDLPLIVQLAREGGCREFIIEQEEFAVSELDSIKVGFENLSPLLA